uniref:Uncharacterized protein n=1 Tax=Glossina palpalis gambiensis TaxID=67801 RepID=A0A1B0BTR0_9MUSC
MHYVYAALLLTLLFNVVVAMSSLSIEELAQRAQDRPRKTPHNATIQLVDGTKLKTDSSPL